MPLPALNHRDPSRFVAMAVQRLWRTRCAMALVASLGTGLAMLPAVAEETSAAAVTSLSLAGNRFEPTYAMGGRQLVLNGGGIRSKMIIKIYAMALYLPAVAHDAQAVLQGSAPHSIQVVMLRDVDAQRMAEGFGKAMLELQNDAGKVALQARVATLSEAFHRHGDVRRGDVLKFEYQPELGTRVSIGGQAICPDIAGQDFNVALKSLWLGEHASDERLKQALMGL